MHSQQKHAHWMVTTMHILMIHIHTIFLTFVFSTSIVQISTETYTPSLYSFKCSTLAYWQVYRQTFWRRENNPMGDYSWTWFLCCHHQDVYSVHENCWWAVQGMHPSGHSQALSLLLCISPLHLWMPDNLGLHLTLWCKEQLPQHLQ